jgi:hypothetical protein
MDDGSEENERFAAGTGYPCGKTLEEIVALAQENVVRVQFDSLTGESRSPIAGSINASVTTTEGIWNKKSVCRSLDGVTAYQVDNPTDMNVGLRAYAIEENANARILLFEDVGGEWRFRKEVNKGTRPITVAYDIPRGVVLKQTMAAGSRYYLVVLSADVNKADITFSLRVGKVPLISPDGVSFCASLGVPDKFFLRETTPRVFTDAHGFFVSEPFIKWPSFQVVDASNRVLGYVHKKYQLFQELLNSPAVFNERTMCMSNGWGDPYLCTGEHPSWGERTVTVVGCDGMEIGRLQEREIGGGEETYYDVYNANGEHLGVSVKYNSTSRLYGYTGTKNPLTTFLYTTTDIGPDAGEDPSKWLALVYRTNNVENDIWAFDTTFGAKAATKIDWRLLITAPASKTASDNEDQITECTNKLDLYHDSQSDCERCCKKEGASGGFGVNFKGSSALACICK